MIAAEAFASFRGLKDLTGATDEQLRLMLAFGCAPLANFAHEDVITENLCRFFRHVTGVTWIRGFEQGARPEGQYGTVWLYGGKAIGLPLVELARVFDGSSGALLDDACETTRLTMEYQFQLDVYRDGGAPNRNQDGPSTAPNLSAFDVLTRLQAAAHHMVFREALREKCIESGSPQFGTIRKLASEMVQNTYESRASVDFFARVSVVSSVRSPTFGTCDWGFVCPEEYV